MSVHRLAVSAFFAFLVASPLAAQQLPELPTATKEHQWLKQFVGEWDTKAEGVAAPGAPAVTCEGKTTYRMLGDFWLIAEGENDMMGFKVNSVQTIGYDAEKKKYTGTWVDSAFNHLWKYEGTVDDGGKKLTLEAEGPNMASPGKTAMYRDAYELKSKDEIIVTSSMQGDDGQWIEFMKGTYRRSK